MYYNKPRYSNFKKKEWTPVKKWTVERYMFIEIEVTQEIETEASEMVNSWSLNNSKTIYIPGRDIRDTSMIGAIGQIGFFTAMKELNRYIEMTRSAGKSDGGIDFLTHAGSWDIKTYKREPNIYGDFLINQDDLHNADFYIMAYLHEGSLFIAGAETRENIFLEENKKDIQLKDGRVWKVYSLPIRYLTIPPTQLVCHPYTQPYEWNK